MSDSRTTTNRQRRWLRCGLRYGFPVFFPVAAAVSTAIAAVNHGATRVIWVLFAIVATAGTAILGVLKERQAVAAGEAAALARAGLAAGLNRAGAPLLAALSEVTSARDEQELEATIKVLTTRVVDLGHSQCGRQQQPRANLRCVYYSYQDNQLVRTEFSGRQSNAAPRKYFKSGASPHDDEVIRLTLSEEVQFVSDLYYSTPPHFTDAKGRSYRSLVAVPVRAGELSFGLLVVDSDLPDSLTQADRGHIVLLAGVLAAGLAHQHTMRLTRRASTSRHHNGGAPVGIAALTSQEG